MAALKKLDTLSLIVILLVAAVNDVAGNLFKIDTRQGRVPVAGSRLRRDITYGAAEDKLTGKPGEGYYMEVEIGTPGQKLNVLIDTGSSNFAVACDASLNIKKYFKMNESSTFEDTGNTLLVPYTQGSWQGILGRDLVTISALPNSSVRANIACITKEDMFFINNSNWQGIFGLGYAEIARPDSSVEPVFDAMVREGKVDNVFSVQLCGAGSLKKDGTVNGTVLFGGVDPSKYTGELYGTAINRERYYEVVIIDILVGGHSLSMDCKEYNFRQTIVDTGTTNLRLPNRVFDSLVEKIKENLNFSGSGLDYIDAKFWEAEKFQCFQKHQVPYGIYPPVTITLPVNQTASFDLVVTAQQYLRPVTDSEADVNPDEVCFKFGISRIEEGTVIGAIVMEGYYVIFDRVEKQVKFGATTCPPADGGSRTSSVTESSYVKGDFMDCAYKEEDYSSKKGMLIVAYVFAAIAVFCMVPLVIYLYKSCNFRNSTGRSRTESESPVTESFVDCDT